MENKIQETDGRGDGESSKSKRARPVKMVAVTVVHEEGDAALVQWTERGKYVRGIVPVASVKDNQVTADDLAAALPYGDDFSTVKGVTAEVAKALKNHGVWTKADALASPRLVREAVMIGYVPMTVQAIRAYAEEE